MVRVKLTPAARSVVDVDVLEGYDAEHDPESFAVLREWYDSTAGEVVVPADRVVANAIADALIELANAADDRALQSHDAGERRSARAGCTALTVAASHARRAAP